MSSGLRDAAGVEHVPAGPDARIVCLVPSITELVCELGLAEQLVGRTGFCIHPWETVRRIPKIGGTKDVKLDRIRELAPTHVIVNVDENRRETAEQLTEFVPHIIVTHPLKPLDNIALYRLLGGIFGRAAQAERLTAAFTDTYAKVIGTPRPPSRVLYLIWRGPWMAVGPQTYIAQTLALFNMRTVPEAPTERYPIVDPSALSGAVDRVLLSSEPYHFKHGHMAEIATALPSADVSLIDGEMTSWYGSRAIDGLRYLEAYTARGRRSDR